MWERLASLILKACELSSNYALHLKHKPCLSKEIAVPDQCEIYDEILVHLHGGGKLGFVQLIVRSKWKKIIDSAKVASGQPRKYEHFQALKLLANLTRVRDEISHLWDLLITKKGGVTFASLGTEPEMAARPVVVEISRCLDWYKTVWMPLSHELTEGGLNLDKVLSSIPREPSLTAEYDIVARVCMELLPPIIEVQIRRTRLKECEENLQCKIEHLKGYGADEANRGCLSRLISAIQGRDTAAYINALEYTQRLQTILPVVRKRKVLIDEIKEIAPEWAAAITNRIPPHNAQTPPGDIQSAWIWRHLSEELNRRHELDAHSLQKEIEQNKKVLRDVTISLIDAKAWAKQIERVRQNNTVRQALVGWLDTIKKLKSTQKPDIRWKLLTEARKLMKLSAKAVPVWIMPLAAVAENFDPTTTRFDVVIIDEASQADLNALIAMYQADKVVIVGDHEQVTPDAVGSNQTLIHNLISTHLNEIPNSRLFDNRFSVYDVGRQSFGNAICLVEHFRCVPEIIAFSNRLSYDGRIKPLRETNSTSIKPACVEYRVNGVAQNKRNLKEAETITTLIKAICKHPAYKSETIGVISMVGDDQAYLIDTMLRKEIDPVEYKARRIACGNSANFQGDERHIMFLSMIDSGKDHQEGPIAKKGEGAFESTKKRYNVAASRAKDQLWVVHSFDPLNDLKPGDLRRDLILHARDPLATMRLFEQEEKHTESEFERQVLWHLVNKGYRVKSQWKVGYYRIDMVVEGNGKRLAVECDGDRWHPIEKLADDMARQAILERLGWTFSRIRGSAFFRYPEQTMQTIYDSLDAIGIPPSIKSGVEEIKANRLLKELQDIMASFTLEELEDASQK